MMEKTFCDNCGEPIEWERVQIQLNLGSAFMFVGEKPLPSSSDFCSFKCLAEFAHEREALDNDDI
jgi:hypothetical protein